MHNTFLFNTTLFNTGPATTVGTEAILSYNGFALKTPKIILSSIRDIESQPDLSFSTYDIAKSHGMGLDAYLFKAKILTLRGHLIGDDLSDVEQILVSMKQALMQPEKELKYVRGDGEIVTTTASCTDFRAPRDTRSINVIPFTIELTTLDPFFYSSVLSESAFVGQTASFSGSVAYTKGSYIAHPKLFITFNSASSVTTLSFSLGGEQITINESIATNDVVVIDTLEKDITINDIGGKDYTGIFPHLPYGETGFDLIIDGTRNADIYLQRRDTYV